MNDFEPTRITASPVAPARAPSAAGTRVAGARETTTSAPNRTAIRARARTAQPPTGAPAGTVCAVRNRVTNSLAGRSSRSANVPRWTTAPARSSVMAWPSSAASRMSCVTSTTVLSSAAKSCAELLLQLGAHDRVERAERLVQEEDRRVEHQRAHQPDALPLAAAQLARIAAEHALGRGPP